MSKPLVGVIGSTHMINDRFAVQMCADKNMLALTEVAGAVPMMFAGSPAITDVAALVEVVDGVLLTGGRANVHPDDYGHEETDLHGPFDRERDAVTLGITRAAIEVGMPVFGVCRGIQEINVALGGTLHPEIRDLPGNMNHRMPPDCKDHEIIFKKRHKVTFEDGGWFHRTIGAREIMTNSLHGQAIIDPGQGVAIEGRAEDGVIEAISVPSAPGLVIGVQWHAEYEAARDPDAAKLFAAFGEAARTWRVKRLAA